MGEARPIVKWVGGKTSLLPELLARVPARYGRYYEPFFGGGALFFALAPRSAVIGDANPDLIAMYRVVATAPEAVIARLADHKRRHSRRHYYLTRDRWNRGPSMTGAQRAAAFIYLNKTCFNGLWRVNSAGDFNVPMGRYANPAICDAEAIRAASPMLYRAGTRHMGYRACVADAGRGDFLYLDPPYHAVATASFTRYTGADFGPDDQIALADTVNVLVRRGCKVLLSNSDTPLIRSLYRRYRIDRVMCKRSVNSNAKKRGPVAEVLVMAGYSPRVSR